MSKGILWFRADLRLSDNLALRAAMEASTEIVPIYILEEDWLVEDQWGFQRTGVHRMRFLLESLQDLKEHLQDLGSDLVIKKGNAKKLLPELALQYDCATIFASKEYTHEEIQIEKQLANKVSLTLVHNSPMIHPDDVPFAIDRMPEVFTAFRKKVEKYSEVSSPFLSPKTINSPSLEETPIPTLTSLGYKDSPIDPRIALPFKGGALAAWKRLDHYFWNTEQLSVYKETRNGMIGADYSSKFSPWLANGCISARSIYAEIEKYEESIEKNKSTYWLKFELLWRDFFKYTAMRYGNSIFQAEGIKRRPKNWLHKPHIMEQWIMGRTNDEFVNANMKELQLTGFMSNRGRQNVASYLVHQLKQDWRAGAAWFESMLIDYDVTSNYGNWIYAAGVGNDPRDRVFNTKRQANMYDKQGEYRKLWLVKKDE